MNVQSLTWKDRPQGNQQESRHFPQECPNVRTVLGTSLCDPLPEEVSHALLGFWKGPLLRLWVMNTQACVHFRILGPEQIQAVATLQELS
jgi:hypothetical protein